VGALGIVGQPDREVDVGDGALGLRGPVEDGDGVAEFRDAHLLDGDFAVVRLALHIVEKLTGLGLWSTQPFSGLLEAAGLDQTDGGVTHECLKARVGYGMPSHLCVCRLSRQRGLALQ
jgi:hypothetical protein